MIITTPVAVEQQMPAIVYQINAHKAGMLFRNVLPPRAREELCGSLWPHRGKFVMLLREADPGYTISKTVWQEHRLLAMLYNNPEEAMEFIHQNVPMGFKLLLSGLSKLCSRHQRQLQENFLAKLGSATKSISLQILNNLRSIQHDAELRKVYDEIRRILAESSVKTVKSLGDILAEEVPKFVRDSISTIKGALTTKFGFCSESATLTKGAEPPAAKTNDKATSGGSTDPTTASGVEKKPSEDKEGSNNENPVEGQKPETAATPGTIGQMLGTGNTEKSDDLLKEEPADYDVKNDNTYAAISTGILRSIPEILCAAIAYKPYNDPYSKDMTRSTPLEEISSQMGTNLNIFRTNKKYWYRALKQIFHQQKTICNNFVIAELYFNPKDFLEKLTTPEIIAEILINLFTELKVLQCYMLRCYQTFIDGAVDIIKEKFFDMDLETALQLHAFLSVELGITNLRSKDNIVLK